MTDYLGQCFTKGLRLHFKKCRADVDEWLEKHKDDELKLPMNEGAIFIGGYEGADEFRVGKATISEEGNATVIVHLTYTEAETTVNWTDVAMLRLVEGKWLLDNIRFDPENWEDWTLRDRVALDEVSS